MVSNVVRRGHFLPPVTLPSDSPRLLRLLILQGPWHLSKIYSGVLQAEQKPSRYSAYAHRDCEPRRAHGHPREMPKLKLPLLWPIWKLELVEDVRDPRAVRVDNPREDRLNVLDDHRHS